MATLATYFGTHTGNLKIFLGFFSVGSGTFTTFTNGQTAFTGSYAVFGKSGDFTIGIKLDGDLQDSGPCELTLNGKTDASATYDINGEKLTLTTTLNDTPIDIYPGSQNGTQVDNVSGHNFWIG